MIEHCWIQWCVAQAMRADHGPYCSVWFEWTPRGVRIHRPWVCYLNFDESGRLDSLS